MKAVLNDDGRDRKIQEFSKWKAGKLKKTIHPGHLIAYANSPAAPKKMS